MKWIAGWTNRIKFEIDHTKIEEPLQDFPLLVNLDTTYSGVFNELGNNNKRIAFLNPNTGEQYYCEIENWDSVHNSAQLWLKIPTITSGINTIFYMLYDNDQIDNTRYIGNTSSEPAQKVWKDTYKAVYHLAQDPSVGGTCILDSSPNEYHGTPNGSMTSSDLVNSLHGKALKFDGVNDYIDIGNVISPTQISIEAMYAANITSGSNMYTIISDKYPSYVEGAIYLEGTDHTLGGGFYTGSWRTITAGNIVVNDGNFHYTALTYNKQTLRLFSDNSIFTADQTTTMPIESTPWRIGTRWDAEQNGGWWPGKIGEIRISNTALPDNWIKTTYYTLFDQLLIKGPIEHNPTGELNYKNKIKIIIPHGYVENFVTNFPIKINISNNSGANGTDLTFIFDELNSVYNRKKIAITDFTGIEECYIEIEHWDQNAREAILWVKIPIIYANLDTPLYFYYDKDALDNYLMVGDTNSRAAENVWNPDYMAVYHMNQAPLDEQPSILDSTKNKNHGTPYGDMSSDNLVNGPTGKAIYFDGMDDYINLNNVLSNTGPLDNYTIDLLLNTTTTGSDHDDTLFSAHKSDDSNLIRINNDTKIRIHDINTNDDIVGHIIINNGEWHSVSVIAASSTGYLYVDNKFDSYKSRNSESLPIDGKMSIGQEYDSTNVTGDFYKGIIAEVRISKGAKSYSWTTLTGLTLQDNILIYELEKTTDWLKTYENGVLTAWNKRIKLKIDNTKINETLTNFPALIHLSNSSGLNNKDLSDVLKELKPPSDVNDSFTGIDYTLPNNTLWDRSYIGKSVIKNNHLYINDNTGGIVSNNALISRYLLQDDFSFEISFNILNFSGANDVEFSIASEKDNYHILLIRDLGNDNKNHFRVSYANYDWSNYSEINWEISPNTFKFKITRLNNQITIFIWYNNTWSWKGDNNGYTYPKNVTQNINTSIACLRYGQKNSGYLEVELDAFKLNYGSIIWSTKTNPNRKKIAMTTEDGNTQLPIEINTWEVTTSGIGNILLWTKVPCISSQKNTNIYLYYDKNKSDNTNYVGNTGETTAQNVWDNNYIAVYHFEQDPTQHTVVDSTYNNYNAYAYNIASSEHVAGINGKAYKYNGSNTYVKCPSFGAHSHITFEAFFNRITGHNNDDMVLSLYKFNSVDDLQIYTNDVGVKIYCNPCVACEEPFSDNTFVYGAGTYNQQKLKGYVDGELSGQCSSSAYGTSTEPWIIGSDADGTNAGSLGNYFKGIIDEVRFSNIARSTDWVKTNYLTITDNLIFYNDYQIYVEPPPEATYYYHGKITEKNNPVERKVFLYDRNSGKLVDSTSSEGGYYKVNTPYNIEHFIVVLDDDAGITYDPLISDRLLPNGE